VRGVSVVGGRWRPGEATGSAGDGRIDGTTAVRPWSGPVPAHPDRVPEMLRVLTDSQYLSPFGGVEVSTLQDTAALVRRGHQVDLLYGDDGPMRSAYQQAGVSLTGPVTFSFGLRTAPRDLLRFVPPGRTARTWEPDVLWLNRAEHVVWGQVVSRTAGCPLVAHLHAVPAYRRMALLSTGVAAFIAVSDFVKQAYVDRGIRPERITRVHNALPPGAYPRGGLPERAAARAALRLPGDAPVVLCYGQASVEKGVATLAEAWADVRRVRPDALLVVVDSRSGNPDPVVAAALQRLDPASYRLFPATSDVVPFLHASDVVAFPTQLPESFGRVALEGMATGRPVVASRIGAVPEVLTGAMARMLVAPRSAPDLAAGLAAVLDWRTTEPGLGEACAAWVDRTFCYDSHVSAIEQVLVAHRRTRRRAGA
jgi:glycosyltransferase involved in cell wall biosynthesis